MANDEPFDLSGPQGANAVVLMHGVTANRRMWQTHARKLADRYRVVALDLPGHGALDRVPFRLDAAVELLAETIGVGTGGRAMVVGDSLGGYVAMAFAHRHPELAAGLVLASCTLSVQGAVGLLARVGAHVMSPWAPPRPLEPEVAPTDRSAPRRWMAISIADPLVRAGLLVRAKPEAFRELAGTDFRAMLCRYPGPVLILNGERDLVFRLGERSFLRAAPDARIQIIGGAGHTASLEKPDAFVAAIRAFASSIGW